ncbi:MAG: YicC family protein [Deltaproteobacteria bacterium]|nr:YicC family protein [Deltaproteobacteria bacterium]
MAVKSMTGFGGGESVSGGRIWTVELRCVNHRYLDLKMKVPHGYSALEEKIRKKVAAIHQRGRVDLFLGVSGDFSDLMEVKVNLQLAGRYRDALEILAKEFGTEGGDSSSATLLASYPDVLRYERQNDDLDEIWPFVEQALDSALDGCNNMRMQEGEALAEDLTGRLDVFAKTVATIETALPDLLMKREKNLQERLEKLLGNVQLEPARLAQEVAVIADKTDVTEEIVRLRSHIGQFALFLEGGEAVGRKLDFLIQEFLREVNTLASKISDAAVAHLTVDLKSELEKMREQVQNIE